jgi:hypothetical protein
MSDLFSEDYGASRVRFLADSEAAGGRHSPYAHPNAADPQGGALFTDVVELGPATASRRLLLTTGVHGLEGLAGAGVLRAAFRAGLFTDLTPDLKVVLVHAVNPWGMAHQARGTEHNVDLNRNFVDFPRSRAPNIEYEAVDPIFSAGDVDWASRELADQMQRRTDDGLAAWIDGIFRGQYTRPRGVAYGGAKPQWSNLTMTQIAHDHLRGGRVVSHIDWHTGLGGYGEPYPIPFHAAGSESLALLTQWHGLEASAAGAGFASGSVPQIEGLMAPALEKLIEAELHLAMVVEFGTRPNAEMFRSYILDRWLRFEGAHQPERAAEVRAELIDCYYPSDPVWRAKVADAGVAIIGEALGGLHSL